jgi:hypothetical protein
MCGSSRASAKLMSKLFLARLIAEFKNVIQVAA